ncbi:MAG: DUF2922 family protein [Enterococcus gilvus]
MSIETTNLVTTFADGEGHAHNWTYRDVDTSLTPQEMKAACELLTTLDIFEKDGVKLFDSVVSGKLVTKKISPIFDSATDISEEEDSFEPDVPCFPVAAAQELAPLPEELAPQLPMPVERPKVPAVVLADTATINQPSLIKNFMPIGNERTTSCSESSVKTASSYQAEPAEKKPRKKLLDRLFRRKKNKGEPDSSPDRRE